MSTDKKAPLLKKDLENEQDIENQDYEGASNTAPSNKDSFDKANSKSVPESNDPVGFANEGNKKESPSGQRND